RLARRHSARPHADRVRAARALRPVGRARPHTLRDPRRGVGLRLRPDLELARGLRRLPAAQARGRRASAADPHRARRRLRLPARAVTIGRRVILATSAALVAVVVLLSLFAYELVKHELYARTDTSLNSRVEELKPTALQGTRAFRSVIAAPGELV